MTKPKSPEITAVIDTGRQIMDESIPEFSPWDKLINVYASVIVRYFTELEAPQVADVALAKKILPMWKKFLQELRARNKRAVTFH